MLRWSPMSIRTVLLIGILLPFPIRNVYGFQKNDALQWKRQVQMKIYVKKKVDYSSSNSEVLLPHQKWSNQLINTPKSSSTGASSGKKPRMIFFQACLERCGLSSEVQDDILDRFAEAGFYHSMELYRFATDFAERPEVLSSILHQDFNFSIMESHRARVALMELIRQMPIPGVSASISSTNTDDECKDWAAKHVQPTNKDYVITHNGIKNLFNHASVAQKDIQDVFPLPDDILSTYVRTDEQAMTALSQEPTDEQAMTALLQEPNHAEKLEPTKFKSIVVNKNAVKRRQKSAITTEASNDDVDCHNYGLQRDCSTLYPRLQVELDQFLSYMTEPSAMFARQEDPIRKATANVYTCHARLFLGWYVNMKINKDEDGTIDISGLSLFTIIPSKESKSAQPVVEFILWLRKKRNISNSYEANVLRGLIKLIKYRFAAESSADTFYGEKSFQDIPVVRELRRLHRDANKKQSLSPRSSDENLKWLSWEEYLNVVEALKNDVSDEIRRFDLAFESSEQTEDLKIINTVSNATRRRIAIKYQNYLVLAFFSCVPDRQRTFRELELGRTFLRYVSSNNNTKAPRWIIKHGPEDYKTGGTYGDRPPLVIAPELTVAIDDFLERWRPCLQPTGSHVFVQTRTGNPFTQDSVYSVVGRCCFRFTGKKTNPHLLRDMIVTHVRQSDASEKELEALALYMGHSITMQRTSYDRRTMQEKVAPAVDLLQSMNNKRHSK